MSRAYRIRQSVRVHESLTRDLTAGDEICTDLELLEILPPEQMGELLKGALRERGFEEEDGQMVRRKDGITVRVNPETATVTIEAEGSEQATAEGTKEGWVYEGTKDAQRKQLQEQLRETIRKELEKKVDEQADQLQRKVSAELEAQLGELSQELDQVINRVTAEALKRKAASLGEIKEMQEDPESGSLTITVKV